MDGFFKKDAHYMSSLSQFIPLVNIKRFIKDSKALFLIDNVKKTEAQNMKDLIKKKKLPYKVQFVDSKDCRAELIQIADVIAGISREYFETTLKQYIGFLSQCAICSKSGLKRKMCVSKKISKAKPLCLI